MQDDSYQEDIDEQESGIGSVNSSRGEDMGREDDQEIKDTDSGYSE